MESEGETSVGPFQSQLILYEVISSAESHSHTPRLPLPYLYFEVQKNSFSCKALGSVPTQELQDKKSLKNKKDHFQRLNFMLSVQEREWFPQV